MCYIVKNFDNTQKKRQKPNNSKKINGKEN